MNLLTQTMLIQNFILNLSLGEKIVYGADANGVLHFKLNANHFQLLQTDIVQDNPIRIVYNKTDLNSVEEPSRDEPDTTSTVQAIWTAGTEFFETNEGTNYDINKPVWRISISSGTSLYNAYLHWKNVDGQDRLYFIDEEKGEQMIYREGATTDAEKYTYETGLRYATPSGDVGILHKHMVAVVD